MGVPDHVEGYLSLISSLMSVTGTFFILCCYLLLPQKRHIRHALIINMTIADFINATDNSISGLWVLIRNKTLTVGDGCIANGFIGQLSVQAVDCSILAITIVTMWIITRRKNTSGLSLKTVILICAVSWILPIITSFIALFEGYYRPASTNWCWLTDKPTYVRYVLNHGWRFANIFVVTGIAIYTQIYVRRELRSMAPFNRMRIQIPIQDSNDGSMQSLDTEKYSPQNHRQSRESDEDDEGRRISDNTSVGYRVHRRVQSVPSINNANTPQSLLKSHPAMSNIRDPIEVKKSSHWDIIYPVASHKIRKPSCMKNSNTIEKTMLLNAYPIFYVILWLPGIANRIAEAMGHQIYILNILQSTTQLIGFANALTFGWNERIGKQLREKFRSKSLVLKSSSSPASESGSVRWGEVNSRGDL